MTKMNMENTIAELLAEIDLRDLNAEREAYASDNNKQITKLNKKDLLIVLGDIAFSTKDPAKEAKSKEEIEAEKEAAIAESIAIKEQQRAWTAEHNNTKIMCIVTDYYTGVSIDDEDVPGRVFEVSWGNKMGSVTNRVVLDGEPQYLHVGAIKALEELLLPKMGKNSAGKEQATLNGGKRFKVTQVDGWTDDELEAQKRKQKLR